MFSKCEDFDLLHLYCLRALQYLKEHDVVHRDIKSANILWKENDGGGKHFCLADLGLMKVKKGLEDSSTLVGSRFYIAPEVEEQEAQTPKLDIFSLGMVLLELAGVVVWVSESRKRDKQLQNTTKIPALQDFKMVDFNPETRWSVDECFNRLETAPLPASSSAVRETSVEPTRPKIDHQVKPKPTHEDLPTPEQKELKFVHPSGNQRTPEQASQHAHIGSAGSFAKEQQRPEDSRACRLNKPTVGSQDAGISKSERKRKREVSPQATSYAHIGSADAIARGQQHPGDSRASELNKPTGES